MDERGCSESVVSLMTAAHFTTFLKKSRYVLFELVD